MTEKKVDAKKTEVVQPLRIAFGDVFIPVNDKDARHVVISLEYSNQCEVAAIINTNGAESIGPSGTAVRSYIDTIVDHWPLERIFQAWMNYVGDTAPVGPMYDLLRKNSQAKPQILR